MLSAKYNIFYVVIGTALINFAIHIVLRTTNETVNVFHAALLGGQRLSPPEAGLVTSNDRFKSSSVSCKRSIEHNSPSIYRREK